MKRTILIITALVVAAVSFMAGAADDRGLAANQRTIGFSVNDKVDIDSAYFGTAGTYPVGALLGPASLEMYKGCRVVGLRICSACDLGRVQMFTYGLADNTLSEKVLQKQKIYKGWNNVFFNGDGFEITGTESLFYGFEYVETAEMVADKYGALCCVGEDTNGGFVVLLNNSLNTVSGAGNLCVQLIVDVSSLPENDMRITFFDTGFKYKKLGEKMEIFAQVDNIGRSDASNFRMAYVLDNETPVYVDNESAVAAGDRIIWQHDFDIPASAGIGAHTVKVYVDQINGTDVADKEATARVANHAIYKNTMQRENAYLEIYTTTASPYSAMLNNVLSALKTMMPDVSIAQVHEPGSKLAVDDSKRLHDFYAYTYPSFTSNRSYFPGEANIAYDLNGYFDQLPEDFCAAILADIVAQDITMPCFAGLDITGNVDAANRKVKITVSGETLPEAVSIYGKLGVTLMLVEDGVVSPQTVITSMGRTQVNNNYVHDNVLRGYLTRPEGDAVEIVDDHYIATFEGIIPAACDVTKLKVVALLSKYLDNISVDNLQDADIVNAVTYQLPVVDAVETITVPAAAEQPEMLYSIDGLRVNSIDAANGNRLIIRKSEGRTQKILK